MSEHEDLRWKRLVRWSVIASILWIVGWLVVACISTPPVWKVKLNEAGDYWAGMAAPLAFYWLVLGFFQQGKELNLQIRELRESVRQFERQSDIMQKQFDAFSAEKMEDQVLRELESLRFDLIEALRKVGTTNSYKLGRISYSGAVFRMEDLEGRNFSDSSKFLCARFKSAERNGRFLDSDIAESVLAETATKLTSVLQRLISIRDAAAKSNSSRVLLELKNADFADLQETLTKHFDLTL